MAGVLALVVGLAGCSDDDETPSSQTFDFFILELQFTDSRDGRQFPSGVPFETFECVGVSLAPLGVPSTEVVELDTGG